ncbi:MAG: transcription factor [Methanosarcinales archaeon]|jgi:transcription initiation factor TFIIE subunit alpha|uniref:Transcription factor E n=1 Tax=Methanothrix soehngenii TaxID=2223 RepID=A0A7K4AKV5_METSH|nr:transcription factor [Methanothrix sp.]NLJ23656.1 transcription factor [Methanothrix soehngenii]NYT08946.1 transcription factor [Methanosarcinales archaeon]OPX81769.1 MAG: Transcription factor E [Methanosaeta sp. PtaB.Bin005]UEC40073.1 MAG: Archaeal transcription factor E [Methanothrix sp.]
MQEHERQQLDQPYPEGPRVGSDAALGVGNNPISHSSHHGSDSLAVIEEVIHRAYLNKLVGEEGLRIVECIPEEEITDERLAELTGISLNTVRRTLYLLYEHRLAIYRRKRDPDSGWLTYLWQLCPENFDKALQSEAKRLLRKLEERLAYEKENIFYACTEGCARFIFDEASDANFVCPFCQGSLEYMENAKVVEAIERQITDLKACV